MRVAGNKKDEVDTGSASVESSWGGSNAGASSNVIDRLGDVCTGSQTRWRAKEKERE